MPDLSFGTSLGLLCATLALVVLLATVRNALLHSHAARLLARAGSPTRRRRLESPLARTEALLESAALLELLAQVAFVVQFVVRSGWERELTLGSVLVATSLATPVLLFACEVLPEVLARRFGDALLVAVLPTFHALTLPLKPLVIVLEAVRRGLLGAFRLPTSAGSTREIVAGLREAIEDAGRSGGLDEVERELIENVMEFRDVDVAAVMTPRTEITGVEVTAGLLAAARLASENGHSRLPVFRGSLDEIVGTISARDMIRALADHPAQDTSIEKLVRPAFFVPETKRLSELIHEFRRERQKMAIVLDEYGGTAGLVTLGDALSEIVGELHEVPEAGEEDEQSVRLVAPGVAVVDAATHVSEVNEELDLEIPEEEDYETLAGFVLSRLGHFPEAGESFREGPAEFTVTRSSDRRVLEVQISRLEAQPSS